MQQFHFNTSYIYDVNFICVYMYDIDVAFYMHVPSNMCWCV